MPESEYFFSCDWGTTNFRLRLVRRDDLVVVRESSARKGVTALADEQRDAADGVTAAERYERFFREQVLEFLPFWKGGDRIPVAASGMVTSSIGWLELPYAETPFPLDGANAQCAVRSVSLDERRRAEVTLVSGLRTSVDVMRGEETELIGLHALAEWKERVREALVLMPGTHSKHVRIESGSVVDFQTCMTGELFELLGTRSILRHSVDFDAASLEAMAETEAFTEGLTAARDGGMTSRLFRTRTHVLLGKYNRSENTGFLYGLLLGAEVRDACKLAGDLPVVVAAAKKFGHAYHAALRFFGMEERSVFIPPEEIDRALLAAHARFTLD